MIQDDNYQFKNMVITIIIIVIILIPLYFVTTLVIGNKDENKTVADDKTVEIQSEKILVGQLFNRPNSEYLVLAYKKDNKMISIFNNYIDDYKNKNDSLTVYRIDLDDGLNKAYIGDNTNISSDLKELRINDTVLFKIVDGEIDSYYIGNNEVVNYLKEING